MKGKIWGVGFCQELKSFWNRPLVHSFSHPANFHLTTPPTNPLFTPFSSPPPPFRAPYSLLPLHFSYPSSTHPLATHHQRTPHAPPTYHQSPLTSPSISPLLYPPLPTSSVLHFSLFSSPSQLPFSVPTSSPCFPAADLLSSPSYPYLSPYFHYFLPIYITYKKLICSPFPFPRLTFHRHSFSTLYLFPTSPSLLPTFPSSTLSFPVPFLPMPFHFPFFHFLPFLSKLSSNPQKLHKLIFTLFPISSLPLPQKPLKTATFHHFTLSQADLGFLPLLSFV